MYAISKFVNIRKDVILENGKQIFHNQEDTFAAFMKNVYKSLNISYPKFYKMDDLCKLAFIASELLLQNETEKDIVLLFSNNEASLDTDLKHQQSIQNLEDYYPSPAVFVYTLPNITIGEVSIRHQLKSESAFFVAENYQTEYMLKYAEYLLKNNKAEKVLCGWIHFLEGDYKADFYLVEKNGILEHSKEHINDILK